MSIFRRKKKTSPTPDAPLAENDAILDENDATLDDKEAESDPSTDLPAEKRNIGSLFMGDRVIWVVYFFLCIISLVEVYSAASTLSYKSGHFWDPLVKQAVFLGAGTLLVILIHRIPCRMFKIIPVLGIPITLFLLIVTLLSGGMTNDAARWIQLGPIQFQPSELAKGTVIITTALLLGRMQEEQGANKRAFKWILTLTCIFCALIVTENLSTAALLFGVVVLMMFVGRVPLIQLGKLFGGLALLGVALSFAIYLSPKVPMLHRLETWKERIETHFGGDEKGEEDPMAYDIDKGAQVAHANIAIATCNYVGRMPGNSVQRDFLSQAFSDFIFAVIIEEMGLWGAFGVVFLYVILLFRAGRIASRCERNFPPFLIMGLTLLLVSQAMLNMMVAVGLFPVTGQPLPLISRGGTSTLINCAYIGMILSVSRYARQSKELVHTQFDGPMTDIKHTEERRKVKK